jgi:hypothetical protein
MNGAKCRNRVMKRGLLPLLVICLSAALLVPAAEAKFRLSVAMEPAAPNGAWCSARGHAH